MVAVCFVMLGVSLAIGVDSASAEEAWKFSMQSTSTWCRGC
jgi:hypothetical protein